MPKNASGSSPALAPPPHEWPWLKHDPGDRVDIARRVATAKTFQSTWRTSTWPTFPAIDSIEQR